MRYNTNPLLFSYSLVAPSGSMSAEELEPVTELLPL